MDPKHKKVLQTHQTYLVENLSKIEDVCDCLLQDGILDNGLTDTILHKKPGRSNQTRELLSTLPRRGPKAFDSFIKALKESSNQFIVDKLMNSPYLGGISGTNKSSDATTKGTEQEDIQVSTQKYTDNKESTVKNTSTPNMTSSDWPDIDNRNANITPRHVKKADNYTQILEKHKTYSLKRKIKGKFIFIYNVCEAAEMEEEKKQFNYCKANLDADKVTIRKLFKVLGYDSCECKENKGREEMKKYLQEKLGEIEAQKDSCYDSLVVTILSGGVNYDPGKIYDKDGKIVPLTDITDLIKESQAFKDKPIVVIVQTYSFKDIPCDQLDSAMSDLKIDDCNTDNLFVISSVPKPDYGPWMVGEKLKGSYFIQALAHVICNHSHEMSFLQIIEEVDKCLSHAIVPAESGKKTKKSVAKVVCLQYCKEKELYFFPGLQEKET